MIERHITLTVQAGQSAELERFFAVQYRPAMAQSPGFVRADLLRAADDPDRYLMVLRWTDADAATGWRTSAAHVALQPALGALVTTGEIKVYGVSGEAG